MVWSTGDFTASVAACVQEDLDAATVSVGSPGAGQAWYFLIRREITYCNEDAGSYGTKAVSEQGSAQFTGSARDVGINASAGACTETP